MCKRVPRQAYAVKNIGNMRKIVPRHAYSSKNFTNMYKKVPSQAYALQNVGNICKRPPGIVLYVPTYFIACSVPRSEIRCPKPTATSFCNFNFRDAIAPKTKKNPKP